MPMLRIALRQISKGRAQATGRRAHEVGDLNDPHAPSWWCRVSSCPMTSRPHLCTDSQAFMAMEFETPLICGRNDSVTIATRMFSTVRCDTRPAGHTKAAVT
jgi:hypothetical protein